MLPVKQKINITKRMKFLFIILMLLKLNVIKNIMQQRIKSNKKIVTLLKYCINKSGNTNDKCYKKAPSKKLEDA